MKGNRGQFTSRLGFVLAATGSAVGLGNVWGFPTNTASNGGAAFVLVYIALAFCLAYPALMAELIIGRYSQSNIVRALQGLPTKGPVKKFGWTAGLVGVITASAILGFYSLVAGWMLSHFSSQVGSLLGMDQLAKWSTTASTSRDLFFALIFATLTFMMVSAGVRDGIEHWSRRLMPSLVVLLLILIAYVLTQPGAAEGLKIYLVPDFSKVLHPPLIISALGQAFFSLSLGVGTMLVYGSYIPHSENLPLVGAVVTLVDIGVAFLAGLLILPAVFVAQSHGVEIYQAGQFIGGPDLIFQVLPKLFNSMGATGHLFALVFFLLMTIAALTSSISMLEVPTAWLVESTSLGRKAATFIASALIFLVTISIVLWFDPLFGWVVTGATEYSEPLMGVVICLFAGWGIQRDRLLNELHHGNPDIEDTWFWRVWPFYVRFICPLLIAAAFINSLV